MAAELRDKVYGCVVGGAIGDALGAPLENMQFHEIRRKHGGRLEEFIASKSNTKGGVPGQVTDDTYLRHYLWLAVIRRRGRVRPNDVAEVLIEKFADDQPFWVNERMMMHKLRRGLDPYSTGHGAIPAGCAVMAIAPAGVVNAGDPAQAYQDGYDIAGLNQDGLHRETAATEAAAVAAAFTPGITVEGIIDAMLEYSTSSVYVALDRALALARSSRGVAEFADGFYATLADYSYPLLRKQDWNRDSATSPSSMEILPAAAGIFLMCEGDVNECIIEGANFGRDCDTIGGVLGCIAGAYRGASAVRRGWIEKCEEANRCLFEDLEGDGTRNFASVADRVVEALREEAGRARRRAEFLEGLL